MNRKEAIQAIVGEIGTDPIVAANGYISRDLYEVSDRKENFYMIGSMGLASSIALGVAIKNPKIKVYVFDGDGNILMNLGSLTTIGLLQPKNLIHIIFDNGLHESTGGQPTNTKKIELKKIAKATNYRVFKAKSKEHILRILKTVDKMSKPIMLIVDVEKSSLKSKRVSLPTTKIKKRLLKSLKD